MPRPPFYSIIIATFGDAKWHDLAWSRAYPSAVIAGEGRDVEIITSHGEGGPIEEIRNASVADRAQGTFLVFLDADDELAPDFIDALNVAITADCERDVSILGGLYAPAVVYLEHHKWGVSWNDPEIPQKHSEMPPLNHAVVSTAISRMMFDEVGGFDSAYWPWSDYELWLRACRNGARIVEVPNAVLTVHVNRESDQHTLPRAQAVRLAQRIHREHRRGGGSFPVAGGGRA